MTCSTHDDIYFFTNKGKVYRIKVWDVPEASRIAKGTAIVNLLNVEAGEQVVNTLSLCQDGKAQFLFMTTRLGTVKKTALTEFENIRRTGILAIKIDSGDDLIWVAPTTGKDRIILTTADGKSILFDEQDIRAMGRAAAGIRGIKIGKNDQVVGMDVTQKDSSASLLVLARNGLGKKTPLSEYRLQGRGGSGIFTAKVTTKTGQLVAAKVVDEKTGDFLLTSTQGQVIRLPAKDIPSHGRATQGVRLMRLHEGDTVAAMTVFATSPSSE